MDVIKQLRKKSLVLVSISVDAMAEVLERFLQDKLNTLSVLMFVIQDSQNLSLQCRLYKQGKFVRNFNVPSVKYPPFIQRTGLQVFLGSVALMLNNVLIICSILRLKRRFDIYLGYGYLYTLIGLILRRMKLVDKVIYNSGDYFPFPTKIGIYTLIAGIYQFIDRYCTNHCDIVWHPSRAMIEIREQKQIITSKSPPQILVPLGIDAKRIYQKPLNEIDTNCIGFMGILKGLSGLDLLIDALPDIKRKIPNIKLNIIGSGQDEKRVRNIVHKKGLESHVTFWGFVSDEAKVREILSNCAIGVAPYVPSIDNYTQYTEPGKVKQYLKYGLPVVVTKVPQMAVEIESRRAGFAIEYNKEELVAAILKLLGDRELLKEYRDNALRLALDYDWEVILNKAWSESKVLFK